MGLAGSNHIFRRSSQKCKEKFEEEPLKSLDVHVFDMTKSPITRYNIETALFGGDDGIHPTAETHKVLAREIARRISNA